MQVTWSLKVYEKTSFSQILGLFYISCVPRSAAEGNTDFVFCLFFICRGFSAGLKSHRRNGKTATNPFFNLDVEGQSL